jgi:cell division GTPase FtsZ
MSDLVSSPDYDVVGLIGKAEEFDFIRKKGSGQRLRLRAGPSESESQRESESIVLAFAPNTQFRDVKKYLKNADAIVFCDATGRNWVQELSKVIYHFFESLVVPSMLNIDLADVKHIAKGIGLAFNISDDSNNKIIARLPKSCLVARSALLHFSCDPDVRLKEVYSISKAIALKKGIANVDLQINTPAEAKKLIRKVNVKMGIRVRNASKREFSSASSNVPEIKRISLTAILFGL